MNRPSYSTILKRKIRRYKRIIRQRYFQAFLFIHINKTGGSSIEEALGIPLEHRTAKEKIAEIGRAYWDRKYTFTVVRNPWDKVVSHYHYRWERDETGIRTGKIGFNEWVRLTYGEQDPQFFNYPKMFFPQIRWIADDEDQILVDHVIYFEDLESGFEGVCQELGIKANLPHVKSSQRGHYRTYYNEGARLFVKKWFNKDLEVFGYRF